MLHESPRLWRVAGDFSENALWKITEDIDSTPFIIESERAGVEKLKEDLVYADAPPLEDVDKSGCIMLASLEHARAYRLG